MKTSVGAFRRQSILAPAGQSALACQLAVGVQHLISRDVAVRGKFAVQAALHQALLHAPLGCLGGIRVCHVCKSRGFGRLGTACGVPQQQRGLGAVFGCSHAFRQQGLQIAAGNIVVHAVAHNASHRCACHHDDGSAAATVTEAIMVENAVAMRDAGCTLDETVTWLEAEKVTNQIFFTVGNLDYLIKGGRIGKVTGRAANMLGIKPMILFKEGEIFSGGVARGRQKSFEKALDQLMNYLEAHGGTPDDYRITVGYGFDADEGKRLWMQTRAALRAKYPGAQCEVGLLQIGCTIAVHTGPYALGMGVMRRWKKQG